MEKNAVSKIILDIQSKVAKGWVHALSLILHHFLGIKVIIKLIYI